jgi:hypothetical protein
MCLILIEHILWCQIESSPHSHSVPLRFPFTSFYTRVSHPSASFLQAWPMEVCISHVLNHAIYLFRPIILGLFIFMKVTNKMHLYRLIYYY